MLPEGDDPTITPPAPPDSDRLTRKEALTAGALAAVTAGTFGQTLKARAAEKVALRPHISVRSNVMLTFMNRWSAPSSLATANALFSKFEKENPGINIINNYQPNSGFTYQPAVRNAFASGSPPDLVTDNPGPEVFSFERAGAIRDLTDFYKTHIAKNALPGATTGCVFDGKVWALVDTLNVVNCLWYNPDYLKQYGLDGASVHTWDDWISQLQVIKKRGGVPIYFGAKDLWTGGQYMSELIQRALGDKATAALYNRTMVPHSPSTPKWTDPAVVYALQKLLDLRPYFQDGYLGTSSGDADGAFLAGQSGWHHQGSWFMLNILNQPPSFQPKFILNPTLKGRPGLQRQVTIAPEVIMVSKKSPYWEEIQKFLQFFTRADNAMYFAQSMFNAVPYKFDSSKMQVDPRIKPIFNQIIAAQSQAGADGAVSVADDATNVNFYVKNLWNGSVALLSGSLTPQQMAAQMEADTLAAQK